MVILLPLLSLVFVFSSSSLLFFFYLLLPQNFLTSVCLPHLRPTSPSAARPYADGVLLSFFSFSPKINSNNQLKNCFPKQIIFCSTQQFQNHSNSHPFLVLHNHNHQHTASPPNRPPDLLFVLIPQQFSLISLQHNPQAFISPSSAGNPPLSTGADLATPTVSTPDGAVLSSTVQAVSSTGSPPPFLAARRPPIHGRSSRDPPPVQLYTATQALSVPLHGRISSPSQQAGALVFSGTVCTATSTSASSSSSRCLFLPHGRSLRRSSILNRWRTSTYASKLRPSFRSAHPPSHLASLCNPARKSPSLAALRPPLSSLQRWLFPSSHPPLDLHLPVGAALI